MKIHKRKTVRKSKKILKTEKMQAGTEKRSVSVFHHCFKLLPPEKITFFKPKIGDISTFRLAGSKWTWNSLSATSNSSFLVFNTHVSIFMEKKSNFRNISIDINFQLRSEICMYLTTYRDFL